jgi:PAS domain S-box-containing protein
VLVQEPGATIYYLICVACGLLMLGMAVTEWRRLRSADYGGMVLAAMVLVLGRVVGLSALFIGRALAAGCQEWGLEGLTLTVLVSAYLYRTFTRRRSILMFVALGLAAVAGSLALCLLHDMGQLPFPLMVPPGPVVLALLSGFGLVQWLRHRRQSSWWVGGALLVSLIGAGCGLAGLQQFALMGHLVVLFLFVIETYHTIHTDWSAYGQELQSVSQRALRQTQEMAFLLEVSQAIAASLDLPVVMERASEAVARALNADWAYILLPVDDDVEEMSVAARYGWWGRRIKQDSQIHKEAMIRLVDFSLLRHAITRRLQVLANEAKDYEQFERLHDLLGRPQSGPTLIQPIYLQDRALGVVLLGHTGGDRTFSQEDAKLCQALANQVATAIDNAHLYRSVDEHAQRLADLLKIREREATQRQAILESIVDGVVVAGEAGEVVLANAAAEQILGLPRERLIGQTIKRLYAELLLAGGKGAGDEAVFEWDDKVVRGSLAPVKMPDGAVLGYVAVFRDVTRERQAEESKSSFIATVSHELRTPMTSIKGYIELLAAGAVGNVTPQQRHFLDVVGINTERMVSLVNNLIAVSEMERGPIQIESRPVDLKGVIEEAVQAVRPQAVELQLDLTVNLPSDLSPARGDPQCLRQIMDNLLDNALHYTPSAGRITIWATQARLEGNGPKPRDFLVVSIRDTGVGIPPEDHEHIFEKFYRVKNPLSVEAGGAGMGLAIVKSLVEAHGGQVWVESDLGEGSTFSFSIPASRAG